MKKLLCLLPVLCTISACTVYQVYQSQPTSSGIHNHNEYDQYVFENDTLRIEYDFWAEHGKIDFTIYNKLSSPIYIDWKKSSFIRNDRKYDYYMDQENSVSNTGYVTYLNYPWRASTSTTVSQTVRPERITFIAPKSTIQRSQFILFPNNRLLLQGEQKEVKSSSNAAKTATIQVQKFEREHSPLTFRNYLTFSTVENFTTEFTVDNGFYIYKILEMNAKQFSGSNNDSYLDYRNFYTTYQNN